MYRGFLDFERWALGDKRLNEASFIQQVQNWGLKEKLWEIDYPVYVVLYYYKLNQSDSYIALERFLHDFCATVSMVEAREGID